jgi:hypothetical protein
VCEYDELTETRWSPATSLWLDVDSIGGVWEDYQPDGRFSKAGKDYRQCNGYAIEMTPLYALRRPPLWINSMMTVRPSVAQASGHGS